MKTTLAIALLLVAGQNAQASSFGPAMPPEIEMAESVLDRLHAGPISLSPFAIRLADGQRALSFTVSQGGEAHDLTLWFDPTTNRFVRFEETATEERPDREYRWQQNFIEKLRESHLAGVGPSDDFYFADREQFQTSPFRQHAASAYGERAAAQLASHLVEALEQGNVAAMHVAPSASAALGWRMELEVVASDETMWFEIQIDRLGNVTGFRSERHEGAHETMHADNEDALESALRGAKDITIRVRDVQGALDSEWTVDGKTIDMGLIFDSYAGC